MKRRAALALVFACLLAAPAAAQDSDDHEDTPEETTETSVFVCSPYPDPACFEEETTTTTTVPPTTEAPLPVERPRMTLPVTS